MVLASGVICLGGVSAFSSGRRAASSSARPGPPHRSRRSRRCKFPCRSRRRHPAIAASPPDRARCAEPKHLAGPGARCAAPPCRSPPSDSPPSGFPATHACMRKKRRKDSGVSAGPSLCLIVRRYSRTISAWLARWPSVRTNQSPSRCTGTLSPRTRSCALYEKLLREDGGLERADFVLLIQEAGVPVRAGEVDQVQWKRSAWQ